MRATEVPIRYRQAVVVIHGVGEQRPMDTLRAFVDAVLGKGDPGQPRYVSMPDRLSELLELRTLQDRRGANFPMTHFFEYYWQHKMVGTNVQHVLQWAQTILLKRPRHVPKHLKPLWWIAWGLVAIGIAIVVSGGIAARLTTWRIGSLFVSLGGLAWLAATFKGIVLGVVGDAARYLSPHPQNIAIRQSVRSEGLELLRKLHERGDYDRIIVVGHSLGGVVAYDILSYLWGDYHMDYRSPRKHKQRALQRLEAVAFGLSLEPSPLALSRYRHAQLRTWWELRELGHPWLVTDLITAGTPLAHAAILLAKNEAELKEKRARQELPESPPYPNMNAIRGMQEWRFSFRRTYTCEDGANVRLRALHDGAMFACTRWTNLFYPVKKVFGGDLLGGQLSEWFGPGIRDVRVTDHRWSIRGTPKAHTNYWPPKGRREGEWENHLPYSIPAVIEALDLDCTNTFLRRGPSEDDLADIRQAALEDERRRS